MATGFLYVRSNPQKSRTPYNKSGCGFFVACRKKKNVIWYKRGLSLGGSVTSCKGGDAMNYVTYSDLIQIGILIVALISRYQNRG